MGRHRQWLVKWKGMDSGSKSCTTDEFAEAMASLPNPLGVSRSFEIWSDRAFWMKCVDIESGQLAGIRSCDVFETGNLRADFQSWRRFRRIPPLDWKGMNIETNKLDSVCGLIGFGGSVCIHPDFHSQGLATYLSKVTRYLLLGFHGVDFFVGLIETELKARRLGLMQLDFTNLAKVFDGYYPGRDREMEVSVVWINAKEILDEAIQYCVSTEEVGKSLAV